MLCSTDYHSDIAHVYRKFIGPLPWTSREYAASIQEFFPHIVDTKVLLNTNNIFQFILKKSRTSLSKAFALLCPHIASGVKAPSVMDKAHSKVEVQVDDKRLDFSISVFFCILSSSYRDIVYIKSFIISPPSDYQI